MSQAVRTWIAFLVAPGIPGVLLYLFGIIKGYGDASIVGPLLLMPLAYFAAILVGGPVHILLRKRAMRGMLTYAKFGAGIGLLVVLLPVFAQAIFNWWSAREYAIAVLKSSVGALLVAVVYAIVASVIFWFIAVRSSSVRQ